MDKQTIEGIIASLARKLEIQQPLTNLERDIVNTNLAAFKASTEYDKSSLCRISNEVRYRGMREFVSTHTPKKAPSREAELKNALTAQLVFLCEMYNDEEL